MTRVRHLLVVFIAALAALAPVGASFAQDADPAEEPAGENVRELGASPVARVSVRANLTPFGAGDAVTDAWVAVVAPGEGPHEAQAHALATDEDGIVEIDVDPDGEMLLIWKKGSAPQAVWVSGSSPGTIVLRSSDPVVAKISSSNRKPVGQATVRVDVDLPVLGTPPAERNTQRMSFETRTDTSGLAQIDDLPPVPMVLRAEAAGWVSAELFPVEPGGPTIELTLVRGARVSGLVRSVPGGSPLAGAEVSMGGRTTLSDDDGTFELVAIAPGSHELDVTADDHLLTEARRMVLAGDEERSGLVVSLTRAAKLTGRIVDPDGTIVVDGSVTLHWPAGAAEMTSETFDLTVIPGSGAALDEPFEIAGLRPGDGVVVEARAPGFAPLTMAPISLVPGETTGPLDIVLDPGVGIIGRIVDAAGVGISGAIVDARSVGDSAERPAAASAVTDGRGHFELTGVPWGAVRLDVIPPPGLAAQPAVFRPLRGSPDRPTDVGPLALPTGHVLRGSVAGGPSDALVEIVDLTGRRFETALLGGAFEVSGLAPGEALVRVSAADGTGGVEERVSIPTSWPVELTWQGVTDVRVVVAGLGGGSTAQLRAVVVDTQAERSESPSARDAFALTAETDRDGVAELLLGPGTWRISANDDRGMTGAVEIYLDGLSQSVPVQIQLEHGETVRGEVSSARTGAMIEGARVVVRRVDDGGLPTFATTEMRGGFVARGVPPGFVVIEVEADGHAPFQSRPQSVQRGAVLDVGRIELDAGIELRGELRLGAGVPLRGKSVVLTPATGATRTLKTDLQGRFRATGVAAGIAVLEVDGRRQEVDVPAGSRWTDVVIDLSGGTVVTGRVTADGRPVPFAEVQGWSEGVGALAVSAHCDAYGRFELPSVLPGALFVEVTAPGAMDPWPVDVDVPDVAIHDVEIQLPAGRIAGEVRTVDAPAPGAMLWVWEADANDAPADVVNRGATDADGRFEIGGLPVGRYLVEARRQGSGGGWSLPVEISAGGGVPEVSVRLDEESVVRVRVVDDAGLPLAGGWLQVTEAHDGGSRVRLRAYAGMTGAVELPGLSPGPHDVVVGAPGRGSISVGRFELRRGALELDDVRLADGGALEIEVVHPGYEPAAGVQLRLEDLFGRDPRGESPGRRRPGDGRDASRALWETDSDGVAFVPDLAPGVYVVGLADGTAETTLYTVVVRSGEVSEMILWAPWDDSPFE